MTSQLVQGSPQWLEMRKNKIGASDAPIIMGISPFRRSDGFYKTPYVLWQEKLNLLPEDQETLAMTFGKQNEENARKAYEDMVCELFFPHVEFSKNIPYMMASLDGINTSKDMIVEIKNAGKEDHEKAKDLNEVPAHYYPQLQHQLEVVGLDCMHYFSFHQGEGVIVEVKRDKDYIAEMIEKEKEFWDNYSNFKMPKLTEKDFFNRGKDWDKQAQIVYELKKKKAMISKEYEDQKKLLIDMSENHNSLGSDYRFLNYYAKGSIDYSKVPELQGIDLEPYRKKQISKWDINLRK